MGSVASIEHYRFGAFELQLDDTKVCASSESARSSCVPTSPLRRRKTLPASPRSALGLKACRWANWPCCFDASDVIEQLTSLVDKSLVVTDGQAGATRYPRLETIGQYALDRLRERDDGSAVASASLGLYLCLARKFSTEIHGPTAGLTA